MIGDRATANIQAAIDALDRASSASAETIRGRTHARRFGLLSLAALTFSTMKGAHAADPNDTFLDDDRIAYKDLEHGTFELVTKEAVPRHITVGDPGETVVLSRIGSSVSVSQFSNSAARMEELQAAQREVHANLAQGFGPPGSSTPSFIAPSLLQPINFTQPDAATEQEQLPTLPSIQTTTEFIFVRAEIPAPPPTLTLALGTGPTEIDTVVFDTFTATSGAFSARSSDSAAILTYGISGGTPGNTVLDGITYDVSQAREYGTLYVSSTTGAYTFVPDDGSINALKAPTTENFVVTVSDGTLSANQTFTIDIDGVNDDAIIAGDVTGSLGEAPGIASAARFSAALAPAPRMATGTLTSTDVDDAHNAFAAVASPTASNGGYGTFTMTAGGVWTYTLDDGNSTVRALNVGDKLTDSFTVTTIDGTKQVVTIVIGGINDAAVISGAIAGALVEAASKEPGVPTATGDLTSSDVDNASDSFAPVTLQKSDEGYGTFTMTAEGVWTYKLDDGNSAVQALNIGDKLTDGFTVTTIDGTTQVVTVIIGGSNDAAFISGTSSGAVVEAGCKDRGMPTATGTLKSTDVDNASNSFTPVKSQNSDEGYGTFTLTADGVWTYKLDDGNSAVQALNVGDKLTDSFTVTTIDGTEQVVTITIGGSNDAAVISGAMTGAVVEAAYKNHPGIPVATGTLTSTDADNASNSFAPVKCQNSDEGYGTFTMTTDGVWTYKLDDGNCAVQALNVGDKLTDSFTVTTIDGTEQEVTITIGGSNDAAIISGKTTGAVVEAACKDSGIPTAKGTLTSTDVDNPSNSFTPVKCEKSDEGYGTFTMTAEGVWIYKLDDDNSAVQALNVCDKLTDTFTVTTIDGTEQVVTITIGGSNDAAIISGKTTGSVVEAACKDPGIPTATGTLISIDVDNPSNSFKPVKCQTSDEGYGTFTMTADGVWAYKLDNDNCDVQSLDDCDTLTDSFTVRSADGTEQVVTITIQGSDDGHEHHKHFETHDLMV